MLVRIVYCSTVATGVRSSDVEQLVASARRRNRQLDITGALMVWEGHFVQVLEGREDAVDAVMKKIFEDGRHVAVRILSRELIQRRMFPDWDMGLAFETDSTQGLRGLSESEPSPSAVLADIHRLINEVRIFRPHG